MTKIYRAGNELIILDATPDSIPYIKSANPHFRVESVKPPIGFEPIFQSNKREQTLDKKLNQAMHSLQGCELCAWRCGKQLNKEQGKCGLSDKVSFFDPFIHIGEESVINPALMVYFPLCSMNCVYCIRKDDTRERFRPFDTAVFWERILELLDQYPEVNSLEFGGGDPTIYLPWILLALKEALEDLKLPVVWNCNLYATAFALELLEGVVDVYLPDFRYGNDSCAQRLSGVEGYWRQAVECLEMMVKQNRARVIVRILVMPNHCSCCYQKILDFLSDFKESLWISIMDQYVPVYRAKRYKDINRRPTRDEINEVKALAREYGLRDVNEEPEFFWTV